MSLCCYVYFCCIFFFLFFFFQAEDGIRDTSVTGVQTCALPISVGVGRTVVEDELRPAGRRLPAFRLEVHRLPGGQLRGLDRKSTRLNSSHRCISYAVFCLKKKKKKKTNKTSTKY